MKFKLLGFITAFFLVSGAFLIPVHAELSSSSSQSASIYIAPTSAVTMTSTEDPSPKMLSILLFGGAEIYREDINFTNPSNKDTEVWIKAEGYDNETGDSFKVNGVNYKIHGTDKKGEVTDSFTKVGVIEKPEQGTKELQSLNIQLEMSSITGSSESVTNIYFITLNTDSLCPSC